MKLLMMLLLAANATSGLVQLSLAADAWVGSPTLGLRSPTKNHEGEETHTNREKQGTRAAAELKGTRANSST